MTRALNKYLHLTILILVILHLVGVVGFTIPKIESYFRILIPLQLLLITFCLVYFEENKSFQYWVFSLVIILVGFFVEALGVNTGLIFGHYTYGIILGPKLLNTPLIIGLNWFIVVISSAYVSRFIFSKTIPKIIFSALAMVLLDLFIEPFAVKHGLWNWVSGTIPFSNYAGWFLTGCLFQIYFHNAGFKKKNPLGAITYIILILFFAICFVLSFAFFV